MHFIWVLIILSSVYALPVPVVQDRRPPSQSLSPQFNAAFEPEIVSFFDRAGEKEKPKKQKRKVRDDEDSGKDQTPVAGSSSVPQRRESMGTQLPPVVPADKNESPNKKKKEQNEKTSAQNKLYQATWRNKQRQSQLFASNPVQPPPAPPPPSGPRPIKPRPDPLPQPGPNTSNLIQPRPGPPPLAPGPKTSNPVQPPGPPPSPGPKTSKQIQLPPFQAILNPLPGPQLPKTSKQIQLPPVQAILNPVQPPPPPPSLNPIQPLRHGGLQLPPILNPNQPLRGPQPPGRQSDVPQPLGDNPPTSSASRRPADRSAPGLHQPNWAGPASFSTTNPFDPSQNPAPARPRNPRSTDESNVGADSNRGASSSKKKTRK